MTQTNREAPAPESSEVSQIWADAARAHGIDLHRRHPRLSLEEETILARRIEAGLYASHLLEKGIARPDAPQAELEIIAREGEQARERFILANMALVVREARFAMRKYRPRHFMLGDVIQEGMAGLIRGVEGFDYTEEVGFVRYAGPWIRQNIRRALHETENPLRITRTDAENIDMVRGARNTLIGELGKEPTPGQVMVLVNQRKRENAKSKKKPPTQLTEDEVMIALDIMRSHISLDAPVDPASQTPMYEMVVLDTDDDHGGDLIGHVLHDDFLAERRAAINAVLDLLPRRERQVVELLYLGSEGRRTNDQVARMLDPPVTSVRVSQIKTKVLAFLGRPEIKAGLEPYLRGYRPLLKPKE